MTTTESNGSVTFEFFDSHANSVHLVGSFSDWSRTAHSMQRGDDGWWRLRLEIPPGDHSFQYLINGHLWQADYAANGVEMNDFGCWVSLLNVKPHLVAGPEDEPVETKPDEIEKPPAEPAVPYEEPDVLVFPATRPLRRRRVA